MADALSGILSKWYEGIMAVLPVVIGAILILVIGWIVGRLLGKAVRMILDKLNVDRLFQDSSFLKALAGAGVTISFIFDVAVRLFVYLVAVLAAVDLLNLDYLSALMKDIVEYIPHIIVFIIIVLVGFILIDYFADFLVKFHTTAHVDLIQPVVLVMRIFLYFVVTIFALTQLNLDLTIIYTFLTPIAWGIGIGLGAAIAIIFWFGLKERGVQLMDLLMSQISKK
jgi:small-conductance mechanosensitive channel